MRVPNLQLLLPTAPTNNKLSPSRAWPTERNHRSLSALGSNAYVVWLLSSARSLGLTQSSTTFSKSPFRPQKPHHQLKVTPCALRHLGCLPMLPLICSSVYNQLTSTSTSASRLSTINTPSNLVHSGRKLEPWRSCQSAPSHLATSPNTPPYNARSLPPTNKVSPVFFLRLPRITPSRACYVWGNFAVCERPHQTATTHKPSAGNGAS